MSQPHDYHATVAMPAVTLGIRAEGGRLEGIDLLAPSAEEQAPSNPTAAEVARALRRYRDQPGQPVALEVALPSGTAFQNRVWQALQAIPPGETRTYGVLARELGTGARAVGAACRANPVPVVVPCHRVVAAHGLGGYSGAREGRWLAFKAWLLERESATRP